MKAASSPRTPKKALVVASKCLNSRAPLGKGGDGFLTSLIDDSSFFESHLTMVHSEKVRDLTVVLHIHNAEISLFARFQRADAIGATKGMGPVDGCRHNRFSGSHAHLSAGDGEDHLYVKRGRTPGVKIGGQGHGYASIDKSSSRRIMIQSEVKH